MSTSQRRKKITFHLGLEKTGTTSFQRFCYDHRRTLKRHDVLYPSESFAFSRYSHNHAPLVACYLSQSNHPDFAMTASWRDRTTVVRSLLDELTQATVNNILISAEHFSSRFREAQIQDLASDFADFDCQAALTVRKHDSRVFSAYYTTVMSGSWLTADEFVEDVLKPGNRYARYADTIAAWEHVLGKGNVRIFCYDNCPDISETLAAALLPNGAALNCSRSYFNRSSCGASVIEALRIFNHNIASSNEYGIDNYLTFLLVQYARSRLFKSLKVAARHYVSDRVCMSAKNLERLKQIADFDCEWLMKNYGIALPVMTVSPEEKGPDALLTQIRASELLSKVDLGKSRMLWLARNLTSNSLSKGVQWLLSN